jgi:hypothetical protein
MNYSKKWQVERLFHGDQIGRGDLPSESDWISWDDVDCVHKEKNPPRSDKPCMLIWVKDTEGNVYQAFCFKDGTLLKAHTCEEAKNTTHVARIKDIPE